MHLLNFHLVIHPDGNIWMVDVVESSGSHQNPLQNSGAKLPASRFVRVTSEAQHETLAGVGRWLSFPKVTQGCNGASNLSLPGWRCRRFI
jgi:hypothetical protein